MIITRHPNGEFLIKEDRDTVICRATKEEVETIIGETLEELPEGMTGAEYFIEENYVRYFNRFTEQNIKKEYAPMKIIKAKKTDFEHLNLVHKSKEEYVDGISPLEDCPEDDRKKYKIEKHELSETKEEIFFKENLEPEVVKQDKLKVKADLEKENKDSEVL